MYIPCEKYYISIIENEWSEIWLLLGINYLSASEGGISFYYWYT